MESIAAVDAPSIWARFLARVIDGLVLLIPTLIVTAPFGGSFVVGSDNVGQQIIASALGVLLSYAYYVWMESNRGNTIGKKALGITVTGPEGNPTVEQSAKRNAWMLLSIIPGGLGGLLTLVAAIAIAVTISKDYDGRGFHDKSAGLQLVKS